MRMHCIESASQCDRIVSLREAQVESGVTRNGDVQIAYEDFGKPSRGEKQRMLMDVTRLTEAKSLPLDDEWVRETAAESLRRHAPDRYARSRQLAAGFAAKLPARRRPDAGPGGAPRPFPLGAPHGGTCSRRHCGRNWSARSTGTQPEAGADRLRHPAAPAGRHGPVGRKVGIFFEGEVG